MDIIERFDRQTDARDRQRARRRYGMRADDSGRKVALGLRDKQWRRTRARAAARAEVTG